MEFEEHHMWKDETWLVGSSLTLPSNFGMSEGSLVIIEGQPTSWWMGSFINSLKSGRLNPTIKGRMEVVGMVPETIFPDMTTEIEPKPTLGCVRTPAMVPDMVTICGEGGLEVDEESYEPGEELVWGLRGL